MVSTAHLKALVDRPVQLELDLKLSPEIEAFRAGYTEGWKKRAQSIATGTPNSLRLERATRIFLQDNGDKV